MQDTVIVVPCFNEAARLDLDAFAHQLAGAPNLRFVLVDDGSSDDTATLLASLASRWCDRALPLILGQNFGKAEAVRRGMLRALELKPELVGYWDADLATPLAAIPRFAERLAGNDLVLVIGSRVHLLGADIRRKHTRHYVGRVLATIAASVLGLGVYDTQCGAKLFRAGPVTQRVFSQRFELDWFFDVEMLARLQYVSGSQRLEGCVEMVLDHWVDAPGSKLTLGQFHRVLSEVVRMPAVIRRAQSGVWLTEPGSADPVEVAVQDGE